MEAYFRAVGDKRPDKHGIYLPTCLTEKSIYQRMLDEKYNGNKKGVVCFSQFNRLFRRHFRHVTIPKVSSELSKIMNHYDYECSPYLLLLSLSANRKLDLQSATCVP